jgi:capsular exopolysaccharide synthesis family protein
MSDSMFRDEPGHSGDQGPEGSPIEIFKRAHRLLRGRYALALVLGGIGATAGAVIGYMSQTPLYQSTGRIQVMPMMAKILDDTEMSSMMPMFRNYVNTQAALVSSQRVVERAMQSDDWRSLGRGISPGEKEAFLRALSVEVDNESGQLIDVSFVDPDPKAALVGAREVILAYRDWHAEGERFDDPQRVNILRDKQRILQNEIDRRQTQMQTIAEQYGTLDLANRHEQDLEVMYQLEATQRQLQLELEKALARAVIEDGSEKTPIAEDLDVAQIASVDAQMAQLLQLRRQAKAEVERLRASGIGEKHRDMRKAVAAIGSIDVQIAGYKEQWLAANAGTPDAALNIGLASGGDPDQIKAQLDRVSVNLAAWRAKTIELGKQRQKVEQLARENERDRGEASRIDDRLDQIAMESRMQELHQVTGRISVLSEGTIPTGPAIDRRLKMGAAGVVVGGGLPVAGLMLLGLLGGRYRYSDEASGQIRAPLLGILPTLPDNLTDPEQATVAAHCVHQIRTLLQLDTDGARSPVFAVTSPTSGDGKTSLAISLGFSFASTGERTLLIDFDMIGGGMSTSLKQREESGVLKALDEGSIEGHVLDTWVPRLSLLPVGKDDAGQVSRLSPSAVKRLMDQARAMFDVVVVDTGPILGSLEAAMLGGEADGVVLVLGRGQSHANAQRAFDTLRSVKARVLGTVFNRAKPADLKQSMSNASVRSRSGETSELDVLKLDHEHARLLDGLGPMPRTIAASMGKVA